MLVGGALKLAVNLVLVRIPSINIAGAPWGTIACYLFLMLFGCAALMREVGDSLNLVGIFLRPVLAGTVCCLAARGSYALLFSRYPHPACCCPPSP
jgi:stage V sporulation protein B